MSKPKAAKPKVTRSSSCNCGEVELSVTGVDRGAVVCHCDNCQKSSGSTFLYNYRFTQSELTVVKGENVVKVYADKNTKTGNTIHRHFCSNCGSPMYITNAAFKGFVILCGAHQSGASQPFDEFFPENKQAWLGELKSKAKL